MKIANSTVKDISKIFELYEIATAYMQSKKQVVWPRFPEDLILNEITEGRQWKLFINDKIACIWATTFNDELIWGTNNDQAIYIHRIATHPNFRGQKLVHQIVKWADAYCLEKELKYIRMDTVGFNKGLIGHYESLGFDFLGTKELKNTDGLPDHYNYGPVCLFQRKVKSTSK